MLVILSVAKNPQNLGTMLICGLPRKAFALLAMTADFVILSLCKKEKNPKKFETHFKFMDTSLRSV